jgi:electron transfer flavoprotein beta subunit
MTPGGIFDAYREKGIRIWNLKDVDVSQECVGLKGSPTKVVKSFTKGAKSAGKVFNLEPQESAGLIVEKMKEKFII